MLLLGAHQLALERFILGPHPMVVGEQYGKFLLQPGEINLRAFASALIPARRFACAASGRALGPTTAQPPVASGS